MTLQGRRLVTAMCIAQVCNLLPHVVVPAIMAQHLMPLWHLSAAQAGLMASACTLGKWDVSERAMAELKARIGGLPPAAQSRLKYWIDTGEPRLKARQC